jgi:UDP-2,3-diacylglucosamine pyrophosphatase LpxH
MSTKAIRLIVISDLHLGGTHSRMMSNPDSLAKFLRNLPELDADEVLELVIAGDIVDFLAIPPASAWTDPIDACRKLQTTMRPPSPFVPIFEALAEVVEAGHRLTLMIGNHDVELALPPVQQVFLQNIRAFPQNVQFVDSGRAYRVGGALIEHGNRYDDANQNDWTSLRAIASALSRCEEAKIKLKASVGSRIVEKIISQLKPEYPFIDLFQPQGELVALLLFAFEPSLAWHMNWIGSMLRGAVLERRNARGAQPRETRNVTDLSEHTYDQELADAFGKIYEDLRTTTQQVSISDWAGVFSPGKDGIAAIFQRGEPVPPQRLHQIRLAMRRLLLADASASSWDGPGQQYGEAAKRMIQNSNGGIQTVVMGHTHLARQIGTGQRADYINTGAWVDVVRVPPEVLADGADDELSNCLRHLKEGVGRQFLPTYADLRVEADGHVSRAQLLRAVSH